MANVSVSMQEEILNQIDNLAGNENRSRDELVREAIISYIQRNIKKPANKSIDILDAILG